MSHSPEDHTLRNPPPSGRPVDLERSATAILAGEGFCPQCGVVSVDEDGCCEECGADASGKALDELAAYIQSLQARAAQLEATLNRLEQHGIINGTPLGQWIKDVLNHKPE